MQSCASVTGSPRRPARASQASVVRTASVGVADDRDVASGRQRLERAKACGVEHLAQRVDLDDTGLREDGIDRSGGGSEVRRTVWPNGYACVDRPVRIATTGDRDSRRATRVNLRGLPRLSR